MGVEQALNIIANNGLAIFLVIYYLFIEHPRIAKQQLQFSEKIREQQENLSNAILSLKDKIEELQWSISISEKLDQRIEEVEKLENKEIDNFFLFLQEKYENTAVRIRDELFHILDVNHIQENKETILKDIDNIFLVNIGQGQEKIEQYKLNKTDITLLINQFSKLNIQSFIEDTKNIIYSDKTVDMKKRELNTYARMAVRQLLDLIKKEVFGDVSKINKSINQR